MCVPKIKTNKKQAGQEGFEEVIKVRYDLKKSLSPAPKHKERQELRLIRLTLTNVSEAQRRLNLLEGRNFRKTKDRNNYMKTQKRISKSIYLTHTLSADHNPPTILSTISLGPKLILVPQVPAPAAGTLSCLPHHHHHLSPLVVLKSHGHPAPMFKNSPSPYNPTPFHCLTHGGLSLCASHFTHGETEDRRLCDFPRVTQLTEGFGS